MNIQAKLHDLLRDPALARRIRIMAEDSLDADLNSVAGQTVWTELLQEFNATPEELAALTTPVATGSGTVTPGIRTEAMALANGTASSAICTTTTTSTLDVA